MTQENQPQAGSPGNQPPPTLPVRTIPVKNLDSKCTVLGVTAFAVGAICLVLALLIVAARPQAFGIHRGDRGVRQLRELRSLKFPAQLPQARNLCTEQGFTILNSLSAGGFDSLGTFQIARIEPNADFADIQMVRDTAEGRAVVWARMVDRNGWKLDDIYFARANDRPIKIWASWAMTHQVAALAIIHSDEISADVNAFNTGLDTLSKLLNVVNQFRAFSQNSHSQRY
jgi:hypothetical protein